MIKYILLIVVVVLLMAQTPDLMPYYQAQRNSAMDLLAQCSAVNVELQKKVADLEKRLQETSK
jgi:hypothetical protein